MFPDHDVDCEYNGNIDNTDNSRKEIFLNARLLEELKLKPRNILEGFDEEIGNKLVFPDIIIHKRGTNEENLCIIEAKKSSSYVDHRYDMAKLEAYTTEEHRNNLKYDLGLFIVFGVGDLHLRYKIVKFIDGRAIDEVCNDLDVPLQATT